MSEARGTDIPAAHEHILRDAEWMYLQARRMPDLSPEERRAVVAGTLERLRRIGIHAAAEERLYYPVLARLVGTATVGEAITADHRYFHARMQYLAETDPASTAALQAILYGLHAVITTHIQKEDEIFPPLAAYVRGADTQGEDRNV